jgi:hypothetical protein
MLKHKQEILHLALFSVNDTVKNAFKSKTSFTCQTIIATASERIPYIYTPADGAQNSY